MASYRKTTAPRHLPNGGFTDTGRVRDNNEDAWLADPDRGLWVVADGMGGYQGGEIASRIAVDVIRERYADGQCLEDAIESVQQALIRAADAGQGNASMGTTVVATGIDPPQCKIAWVGDSRAYLWRGGELQRLTHDHSYVQQLLDEGLITASQAEHHPRKNLLNRCISAGGFAPPDVDSVCLETRPGDLLLLCSDGLTNELCDRELSGLLADADQEPAALAAALGDAALQQGGRDNVTVVVIGIPQDSPGGN